MEENKETKKIGHTLSEAPPAINVYVKREYKKKPKPNHE
jgi:hypothetical protein